MGYIVNLICSSEIKRPKRRVQALRSKETAVAAAENEHWSMDFMSDRLFTGERIRLLTVVDNYGKYSPAIEVRKSFKGTDAVRVLDQAVGKYGLPKIIKPDNVLTLLSINIFNKIISVAQKS